MNISSTNASWAQGFAKRFEKEVVERLVGLICGNGLKAKLFPPKHRDEIFRIAQKAYTWHWETQAEFMTLDFKPQLFDGGVEFDHDTMLLLKSRQTKPTNPGPIIASVGLGLVSYRSLGEGKGREQAWQEKVDVLLEECFDD